MQVRLAKTAGFCFGVKRAVDTVYEQIEKYAGEQIYTYGPIIHNQEVVKDLEQKGVRVIYTSEELKELQRGIVVVRSHGVPREVYQTMEERGLVCVDATCPFVKKIHRIVEEESSTGKQIVIIGDATHPEVQGIMGWVKGEAIVVQTEEDARSFSVAKEQSVCVVSQTTFNYNKFKYLVEIISEKSYDIFVVNTICNATKERQSEARAIAKEADAMIVIGDKHSSNTQKLFELCHSACSNTYYIQTLEDLDMNQLKSVQTVGITAGASTPQNIIEEVQKRCQI